MDRVLEPELMDDPNLEKNLHRQALQGLRRINRISGSAGILWPSIRHLAHQSPGGSLRILDIATGSGDVPIALWWKAQQDGLSIEMNGCDKSPEAIDYARQSADESAARIQFFTWDVLANGIPAGYDVVTCSLFLHHLRIEEAGRLLKNMAHSARRLILMNDLVRSQTGLLAAHLGTSLLTRSPIVRIDGPRSVRAAFTIHEIRELAEKSGLTGFSITPHWPFRFLFVWSRQ